MSARHTMWGVRFVQVCTIAVIVVLAILIVVGWVMYA